VKRVQRRQSRLGELAGRARRAVAELIGQSKRYAAYYIGRIARVLAPTRDWSQVNYAFWDKARRGRAKGLEIAGLFLQPLASKTAAWVLGRPPEWKVQSAKGREKLNAWWQRNHAAILRAYEDAEGLADIYLVINADLSVTIVPPDVVEPIVAEDDYSRIVGWRIREHHPHPTEFSRTMIVTDEYTDTERVRTVEIDGKTLPPKHYRNLIGRCPVIHIPANVRVGEVFGHPAGEALLELLHRYGEVILAAIEGNIRQGRPTPVGKFDSVEALENFFNMFGRTETHELADGTTETVTVIDFDSDQFFGVTGDFKWESPGNFGDDVEKILGLLFYLMLQHTEIPEFVWGNAIASSKASAESQMPPFVRWVDKKRGAVEGWALEVARVVLGYLALTEAGVSAADEPAAQWEDLTGSDGRLTLDTLTWAVTEGLVDDETALRIAPLPIDAADIPTILRRARKEAEERAALARQFDYQAALGDEADRLEGQGDGQQDGEQPDGEQPADTPQAPARRNKPREMARAA